MSVDLITYFIVCPLVFLAGFVDAIAGGGGLISLPGYLISGIPVHFALGTNKLSSMLGTLISTLKYAKLKYINYKLCVFAIPSSFIGSAIGARLATLVNSDYLKIVLLFLLPLTFLYILKKRTIETNGFTPHKLKQYILCALVSFVVGTYDGFYGPATGTLLILGFCTITQCSLKSANGLAKAVNLSTNVAAFSVFLSQSVVIVKLGIVAAIFSILGNYLGAKYFEKRGSFATKPLMLFVIGVFVVKVIYDLIYN